MMSYGLYDHVWIDQITMEVTQLVLGIAEDGAEPLWRKQETMQVQNMTAVTGEAFVFDSQHFASLSFTRSH